MKIKEKSQKKAIEDNKIQINNKQQDNKQPLLLSKEREMFKNTCKNRLDKIDELSENIDYDHLKLIVNSRGLETNFSELKDPVAFLDSIEKREISLEEVRHK